MAADRRHIAPHHLPLLGLPHIPQLAERATMKFSTLKKLATTIFVGERKAEPTTIDRVVLSMALGLKPDGTKHPKPAASKPRYGFKPHQSKRERRRRMAQAYTGVLPATQFFNWEEWREAREMHLVVQAERAA